MKPVELRTERLLLRTFQSGDVEDSLAYRNDAEFVRYLPHISHPFTRADAITFVHTNMTLRADDSATFAVTLNGTVIGTVNLELELPKRRAMLGYALGRKWWNRGFATEAARALLAWGPTVYDLGQFWASTDLRNVASQRVLEKLGFTRETVRAGDHTGRDGILVDEVVFMLTPS